MNNTLIENIKIKSDLQYDFLFESNQYEQLDSDLKLFLKESYDSGVNFSIDIQKDKVLLEMIEQDPLLLESIDEGLWDRFKAGAARVGQGLKNVTGIGQQTTDSKDAGVASLFNGFKNKFQKSSTPPAAKKPKTHKQGRKKHNTVVISVSLYVILCALTRIFHRLKYGDFTRAG